MEICSPNQKSSKVEARPTALRKGPERSRPPGLFYDVCRLMWLGIFGFTMRIRTFGLERVDPCGGMIIAVSHVSHLDPIIVSALIRRRISWVSRIEFFQQWFMRTILTHGGAFQVNRNGSALPTMREGLRRLARGEAVGIFPEGELMRGKNSVLRGAKIKHGVCLLAARSGCPVLPVIVLGADHLGRIGPWLPAKRGRLWIYVGQPIYSKELRNNHQSRTKFAESLTAEYVSLYREMRVKFDLPESIMP